jgi:hypothetical protein
MTIKELEKLNKTNYIDLLGGTVKNSKTGKELIIGGNGNDILGIVPDVWLTTEYYYDFKDLVLNQMLDSCPNDSVESSEVEEVKAEDLKHVQFFEKKNA